MKYGFFDDQNREYVITDYKTPSPWMNYLGNKDFLGLVSNTGGGYSFYKDARLRRITRYRYNNVPVDMGGRYIYINDGGDIWNPGWKPSQTPVENYSCRHGMGYTVFASERNGVRAEQTCFVPLDFNGEVWKLTVTNLSQEDKTLGVFPLVEFNLWDAYDDMTNFQRNLNTGEVEIHGGTVYHKTEYRERRNHFSFFHCNQEPMAYETDRETFMGAFGGFEAPQGVVTGLQNTHAHGWSPIAAQEHELTLAPGASQTLVFVLGYVENPVEDKWLADGSLNRSKALAMQAAYDTPEQVDQALDQLKAYWADLLNKFRVETPEDKTDRMVNIWNPYQCMVTFNLSRSASFFESGIGRGMGFRDSNQDILGFVHLIPERAKERLIDLAATQKSDGSAYHQYQPLTKKGNDAIGGDFNDDPLWLTLAVSAYVRETGDLDFLNTVVPFEDDPQGQATMLDHILASHQHVMDRRGPHGLPLIGRADWNDCLNLNCHSTEPGESFQTTGDAKGAVAESTFIAGLFLYAAKDLIELLEALGDIDHLARVQADKVAMEEVLLSHGWDGEWFLRAYDASGQKVGSASNTEGKLFIEPQGFCIMAGVGKESGQAELALRAVERDLDSDHGIVLVQPAYSSYDKALGEITSYPPGYKENAGIFCHNNPWIACAETTLGKGDRAFEVYKKIAPAYREDISHLHRMEPYVYSQMIAGKDAHHHGQAKNSWLTGTAAWNYVAISQFILGVRPTVAGLEINPCIPKGWGQLKMTRHFRGATYEIEVANPQGVSKGVASMTLNGLAIEGSVLPPMALGEVGKVQITMG